MGAVRHILSLVAALEILRPNKTNKMNPLFVLSALFATAFGAPAVPLLHAAPAGIAHAGIAHATPLLHAAPVAAPIAAPAATSVPAPHFTQAKEADVTTIHKVQKEIHTVNEPVHVQKPYEVPYDVVKHVERIVEVPTPVHVAKPVPVEVPHPVAGEPIVKRIQGAPVVRHHHTNVVAQPAIAHATYAHPAPIAAATYAHPAPVAALAHH